MCNIDPLHLKIEVNGSERGCGVIKPSIDAKSNFSRTLQILKEEPISMEELGKNINSTGKDVEIRSLNIETIALRNFNASTHMLM